MRAFRLASLLLTLATLPAAAQTAVSGDVLKLGDTTYRLWAIDTLETHQACADGWPAGVEAKSALRGFMRDSAIACQTVARDGKGPAIARCTADGADLGAEMVAAGMALPLDPQRPDYAAQEATAKEHHRGLHAHDCAAAWKWLERSRKSR
jgi:endonuclease YncB( thermonuclease family)